jgi:hypothetical protein
MKGDFLHSYEHKHQIELITLEDLIQTSQMGHVIMKTSFGKLSFDTQICNKACTLLKLHSSLELKCMMDDVEFFVIPFDNELQQP